MKFVSQRPHPNACALACLAMILDVSLDDVIAIAGSDERAALGTKRKVFEHYGREWPHSAFIVEGFGDQALGALTQKYETLYCGVYSWKDPNFSHAVLIHNKDVYDPWDGINPSWPSDRYIGDAMPITQFKEHAGLRNTYPAS